MLSIGMKKTIRFSILLITCLLFGTSTFAELFRPDPIALKYARAAAKRLSLVDINKILISASMQNCMQRLTIEAKKHDRSRRSIESAVWVIENGVDSYSCFFWDESLRVTNGYNWDGFLPRNTIFSLHTHPKSSGGPRPSESDYNFSKGLGIIGTIFSLQHKIISAYYPGKKKYLRVMKPNAFKYEFSRYYK